MSALVPGAPAGDTSAAVSVSPAKPHVPTLSPAETRVVFPDDMTLREGRARYFARSGFDDRTYVEPWVRLPMGPVPVVLPNLAPRKRAVKVHDLNHVLTGYGTTWESEFQISGFELGMGMGGLLFGTIINSGGVAGGLLFHRQETLAAFARGRATRASTYADIGDVDSVLDDTLGAWRARIGLVDSAPVTAAHAIACAAYAVLGVVVHVGPVVAVAAAVVAAVAAVVG
jgi:hypothetical protein